MTKSAAPSKGKKRRKKLEFERSLLAVRVERYEVRVEAAINHHVYIPEYAWGMDDDDKLYQSTTQLLVCGVTTYPEERAGLGFELTVYGEDASSRNFSTTLKDVQARDKHGVAQFRSYRGRQIPVYNPPRGMGPVEKVRGEAMLTSWLHAPPRFINDALLLLGQSGNLFLAIDERKDLRGRAVQGVTVQTTDPAED